MLKKIIWFFVLPLLVIAAIYFIFFSKKPATTSNTTNQSSTTTNSTATNNENNNTNTSSTPLSGFSTNDQEVGMATNGVASLTIDSVSNSSMNTYHEFKFTVTSDHLDSPYVTAKYLASAGVIRLSFSDVTKDNSGIGYQKAVSVSKDGVVQLYHNISSSFVGEIYDVGITKSTPFKLSAELGDNVWYVILDVQYPGASDSSIDLGSTDFSVDAQDIVGVSKDQKATLASYSYSSSAGVFKFVWNVSSTDTNPIPSVNAAYDSSNNLVVTFPSLSIDKVVNSVNGKALPGGITVVSSRTLDSTVYTFSGFTDAKEYRLSALTSPNQVVLEIKL